jgi:hypothetical protein
MLMERYVRERDQSRLQSVLLVAAVPVMASEVLLRLGHQPGDSLQQIKPSDNADHPPRV